MRILHVITSLRTGGAEHLMVDLLPRLRDMGHEVELLLFDGTRTPFYDRLQPCGIPIHHLSVGGNVYNPLHIARLWWFIRRGHYDIVHTHNTAPQLFTALAGVLCSVVLVTTEHTTSNRRRGWTWYARADRWMYGRYSRIICISGQAQANLERHIGSSDRIITINNGVDIAQYAHPVRDIIGRHQFVVTMVAGFRYQKDQDTLIRAMALLPRDYTLWLVGDGERRTELETLVGQLSIDDRVKFWGVRSDIPQLLEQSDVSVLSSHFEGLSLSSIECMAAGRPFIASDVDGLREVVEDAGVLFPHGDERALARSIRSLCENPDLYQTTATRCQQRAAQYDIALMANRYNAVYQSLVQ